MGQCRTIKTVQRHHLKPYTTPLILRRICHDRVVMLINEKILSNKKCPFWQYCKNRSLLYPYEHFLLWPYPDLQYLPRQIVFSTFFTIRHIWCLYLHNRKVGNICPCLQTLSDIVSGPCGLTRGDLRTRRTKIGQTFVTPKWIFSCAPFLRGRRWSNVGLSSHPVIQTLAYQAIL